MKGGWEIRISAMILGLLADEISALDNAIAGAKSDEMRDRD